MCFLGTIYNNFTSFLKPMKKENENNDTSEDQTSEKTAGSTFALFLRFIVYAQTLCLMAIESLTFPETWEEVIDIMKKIFLLDLNLRVEVEVVLAIIFMLLFGNLLLEYSFTALTLYLRQKWCRRITKILFLFILSCLFLVLFIFSLFNTLYLQWFFIAVGFSIFIKVIEQCYIKRKFKRNLDYIDDNRVKSLAWKNYNIQRHRMWISILVIPSVSLMLNSHSSNLKEVKERESTQDGIETLGDTLETATLLVLISILSILTLCLVSIETLCSREKNVETSVAQHLENPNSPNLQEERKKENIVNPKFNYEQVRKEVWFSSYASDLDEGKVDGKTYACLGIQVSGLFFVLYFMPFNHFLLNKVDFMARLSNLLVLSCGIIFTLTDKVGELAQNITLFSIVCCILLYWIFIFRSILFTKNFWKQALYSIFLVPTFTSLCKKNSSNEIKRQSEVNI
eukprot:snap_masked-scaffold_16-processed-gene-4.17-mRNA-1 protein AED:1.00 eAED:1.00 QI:0/0/0/0/1/1/2/0/453